MNTTNLKIIIRSIRKQQFCNLLSPCPDGWNGFVYTHAREPIAARFTALP